MYLILIAIGLVVVILIGNRNYTIKRLSVLEQEVQKIKESWSKAIRRRETNEPLLTLSNCIQHL